MRSLGSQQANVKKQNKSTPYTKVGNIVQRPALKRVFVLQDFWPQGLAK
jgi:hypothetical protein